MMANSKTIKYIFFAATSFVALAASVQAQDFSIRSSESNDSTSLTFSLFFDGTSIDGTDDVLMHGSQSVVPGLAGDTFSWVVTAVTDWNTATAQSQISANTLGTYLSGLTAGQIGAAGNGRIGVVGGSNDGEIGDGEALIFDFDVSGLNNSSVLSLNMAYSAATQDAAFDYLIYDSGDNTVVTSAFNSTDFRPDLGDQVVQSDWIMVLSGTGGEGVTGDWRLNHLLLGFTPTAVPEPGTFALLAGCAAFVSIMLRRRR
jgi:hypothetical protein